MRNAAFAPHGHFEPGLLEHAQHRDVARQNFCDELTQGARARDGREMLHQQPAKPASLVRIVYSKRDFRDAGLADDVAAAADDQCTVLDIQYRHQRNVAHKVDIQVVVDLVLAEISLRREETTLERLIAHTADCALQLIAIGGLQRTYLDAAAVAQHIPRLNTQLRSRSILGSPSSSSVRV